MSTSRFASLAKGAQVSAEALASAIAGMSADDLKSTLSADQLAALTPAPAPAASEEDAGDKPKKMKGKDKKKDMEAEDGDYEEEDDMSASLGGVHGLYAAISALAPTASLGEVAKVVALAEATFAGQSAAAAPANEPSEEGLGAAALASAIRHNNANLGAGGEPAASTDASAIWEKAIAANNPHLNR